MKKIIRKADEKRGIVQITTSDERWYSMQVEDAKTGLPEFKYVPSVTWICDYYPKGVGFYKWLANKGWDEAEAIKEAAGNKGSKVHQAIQFLLEGGDVPMGAKFRNQDGNDEELSLEEYECIMSFVAWYKEVKPEVIEVETVVWSKEFDYAGTVDLVCKIDGELWIIDFKTGQYVWPTHTLQVSAYKNAEERYAKAKLSILQIGYKKNKAGFKWNPVEDKFQKFIATRVIWQEETAGQEPKQRDYPLMVSLKESEPVATESKTKEKKNGTAG